MRRLLTALLLGGVLVTGLLLHPTAAYACSCAGISTARALESADTVFVGTVTGIQAAGGEVDIRFETTRVYKGTAFQDQVVRSAANSAACGLTPEVGSSWVIFAQNETRGEGDRAVRRLTTTLCDGNLPGPAAPTVLGPGAAPRAGQSDRDERAVLTDRRATRGLTITVAVGIGVIALAGIGLAVLWRPGRRRG